MSRHALDPNVVVYETRGDYAHIVQTIDHAERVDLMGISLGYSLEHIKDHTDEYVRKVGKTRILLPGMKGICDDRDIAQGSRPGALWDALADYVPLLEDLENRYPSSIFVRYFETQPYLAMTRVDEAMWVSPYVTLSGQSCPVLALSWPKSSRLFRTFSSHFDNIWSRSKPTTELSFD